MFDTGIEPTTLVVEGGRLDDRATFDNCMQSLNATMAFFSGFV